MGPVLLEANFVRILLFGCFLATWGCGSSRGASGQQSASVSGALSAGSGDIAGSDSEGSVAPEDEGSVDSSLDVPLPVCPTSGQATLPLPGVQSEHLQLDYWLEQWASKFDLDEVLLSPAKVHRLSAAMAVPRENYYPQRNLLEPLDRLLLIREVNDRRVWAQQKLSLSEKGSADYVDSKGRAIAPENFSILEKEIPLVRTKTSLRVVLQDTQIHCAPLPFDFYSPSLDLRLNRNACSTLRAQELVNVVAEWPNGMRLIQAAYSFGWLAADAALSPPVPKRLRSAYAEGPWVQVVDVPSGKPMVVAGSKQSLEVAAGTFLPAASRTSSTSGRRRSRAHVALAGGFAKTALGQARALRATARGLTRRHLFTEAWRHIGTPYGLGGTNAGRDCSRLLLDAFASVDIHLPRHSSWQAKAGSFSINMQGADQAQRLVMLDAAMQQGIVLLYFPGHIMLYLGRDKQGIPRVLHAFGEYLEPCEGSTEERRRETLLQVKDITVSGLELGGGTSRRSFLERITKITVFGKAPPAQLSGVAQLRPHAPLPEKLSRRCSDSRRASIYALPERPNVDQPLRIVTVMDRDPGMAGLTLIDPDGKRFVPPVVRLGGPPYGQVATIDHPQRGVWRAIFSDGKEVTACQRIRVFKRRPALDEPSEGPVWKPRWGWSVASENLYALFVERLFDYPSTDDRVWPNLHSLLRDSERNILHDYRGFEEDELLELQPDCADLPYTLRAYYAWKMRMPFGYRRCSRARNGKPPNCDQEDYGDNLFSNLMNRLELKGKGGKLQLHDDVEAFDIFVNRHLRYKVHSSSGRTLPEDDKTDFYPVSLTRRALKPGTLFADPYGHLLVVADWRPQSASDYGMLVAVDAQPDGTIGRRRFWRGSFLFNPDTSMGGAGFKAFRPRKFVKESVVVDLETGTRILPEPGPDAGIALSRLSGLSAEEEADDDAKPAEPTVERIGFLEDLDNDDLRKSGRFARFSEQQYGGDQDDFYAAVDALINPRARDPQEVQRSLVDALAESVARRVTSINNGEHWVAEHPQQVMAMPVGPRIFLSAGPWEDFSTPSRDLRLLISIDSVVKFSEQIRRAPRQFGVEESQLSASLQAVDAVLREALASHTFSYRRSGGELFTLSLQDVVDRSQPLEMAYNPNDCIELRWGAQLGTPEAEGCVRRAPQEQQERMSGYRPWFATRSRPAR